MGKSEEPAIRGGRTAIIKSEERNISINSWQTRWDQSVASPNAVGRRWMHRLLPDIARGLAKPELSLSVHLTQALSGQGCSKSYLLQRNRTEDSYCVYCMDSEDTTEHILFICPRWADDHVRMTKIMRRSPNAGTIEKNICGPSTVNMPESTSVKKRLMLQAKANHDELISMIESILTTQEDEWENEAFEKAATNRRNEGKF